jgi:glycosyltransferase involved in cell wall biosynthesis
VISLIICTRNRRSSLGKCLQYVEKLQSPPGAWELVIVDNGSTDGTAEFLRDFSRNASAPVALVYESERGLSRARNAGISRATGDILAFTDDDCYLDADFLIKLHEVFQNPKIGYAGGRILLYDEADAPVTLRTETEIQVIEPHSYIRAGQLHGANMAVRRSVFSQIGGFDVRFGAGARFQSGEDTDFQARASASGATGIYHPGPVLWHDHGRKPGESYNQLMRVYDYGRGAYFAKFILNAPTRSQFLKNWYWTVRSNIRDREFGTIFREIAGAASYVWAALWKKAK